MPSCSKVHAAAAAAKYLQLCPTLCDPIDGSPPGYPVPRILQARTLELGCHFLLQCMKVKSESEAAQSCPTLSDPMDCSPPGSSVHGIFQAGVLGWGAIAFSVPFSTRMANKCQLWSLGSGCMTYWLEGFWGFFTRRGCCAWLQCLLWIRVCQVSMSTDSSPSHL